MSSNSQSQEEKRFFLGGLTTAVDEQSIVSVLGARYPIERVTVLRRDYGNSGIVTCVNAVDRPKLMQLVSQSARGALFANCKPYAQPYRDTHRIPRAALKADQKFEGTDAANYVRFQGQLFLVENAEQLQSASKVTFF
jgi:hypothetical protein